MVLKKVPHFGHWTLVSCLPPVQPNERTANIMRIPKIVIRFLIIPISFHPLSLSLIKMLAESTHRRAST